MLNLSHICLSVLILQAYGYDLPADIEYLFSKIRKTHNSGVFDAYTDEMRRARKSGILTGLPDGYGRGRIIGDYRRVPLYGVDKLIEAKKQDLKVLALCIPRTCCCHAFNLLLSA